jgi:hypothetical protein
MKELLLFLVEKRWDLLLIGLSLIYRREIFQALKGGNGVLQIDELAKGLIMLVFYLSFEAEVNRKTEVNVFPEEYWFALLFSVATIAGIKYLKKYEHKNTKHDTADAG